ncbi:MAG: class I SAM-dependent methyltransferase [Armatimonadota bacterium]
MRSPAAQPDQFARLARHYDALMANVPYGLWADYVMGLAALAGRPIVADSKLLDLATGTGSVALQFARRGCDVTGVDLSAPMIREARRKAKAQGLRARFLCHDLADLTLPPEFDHAVCLYDSLNYITDPARLKQAFANIRNALKHGGLLIFDVNTVRALEAELFTQESRPDAEVSYRWKSRYDPRTRISTIRMDFQVTDTGERFRVVHRQRGYTDSELRALLLEAGFARVVVYDGYRLTPPTPESDRAFYVAAAATA